MNRPELKYIGRKINIKALKDCILDNSLTENDIILLHPNNHDDIVIEHRETYGDSIDIPFQFLGIMIMEDFEGFVPENRVGIKREDEE